MRPHPSRVRAALLLPTMLCVAGCGGTSTPSRCASPSPFVDPPPPSATAGPVTASADRGRVDRGGHVDLALTVTGPARYSAPCGGPVTLIVSDRTGLHLFSDAPPAQRGTPCGDVTLAAGAKATYPIRWQPDPTLPSLAYDVSLALGDQQALTLSLLVGANSDFAQQSCALGG